jgi:hypothetical protein
MSGLGLQFDEVVLDFEMASRKAIKNIYPRCKVSHCHFHFSRVKQKKLQNIPTFFISVFEFQCLWINMKRLCSHQDFPLLRKMSTLALLPPDMIEETYLALKEEYNHYGYDEFFKYFNREWMKKVSLFSFHETDMIIIVNYFPR